MSEQQSIKDTLDVIRKALEDENIKDINEIDENILILDKMVKEDGTINLINNDILSSKEVKEILSTKIDKVLDENLSKWLDKNIPLYLEKYLKDKKF